MGTPTGRILVEGGPVDRRSKHLVSALLGFIVGVTVAVIVLFAVAIKAAHTAHTAAQEVRAARVEAIVHTCREANERHRMAQAGLEALALKVTPRARRTGRQREILDEFVEALAPSYDCRARVRELTRP